MSENTYNFIEFNSVGGRVTPIISLGITGGIGVSAGFSKKYDLSNVIGVKLLYDTEKKVIGIKFLSEKEDGMMKLKPVVNGGYYINAKSFMIKFDIDAKLYTNRYAPKEIEIPGQGKIYVIEIKENK